MHDQHPSYDVATQPFRLTKGVTTEIVGSAGDISVFAPASLTGCFEPHLQALFARLVQPDWTCLDVGANIGLHALYLASLARRVVAFEAAPRTFRYLAANRERLPMRDRLDVVEAALWDETATLRIAVPTNLEGCAFIAGAEDDDASSFAKVSAANPRTLDGWAPRLDLAEVGAMRLDDWLHDNPLERLDLIKIDVEGSEPRVLAGAAEALRRYDPIVVTEYNANCARCCFGEEPRAYFDQLASLFRYIRPVDEAGLAAPLAGWDELAARLSGAKFWTDLACSNRPIIG